MKRVGVWAIGLVVTVGLLTVQPGYAQKPKCTLETLKGRYLFATQGMYFPPAFGVTEPTPSAVAGFRIFNGDGTGTDIVTFRLGGETVLENEAVSFNYTVNEDCTGSLTVTDGPPVNVHLGGQIHVEQTRSSKCPFGWSDSILT
jgi:hypothetical protein